MGDNVFAAVLWVLTTTYSPHGNIYLFSLSAAWLKKKVWSHFILRFRYSPLTSCLLAFILVALLIRIICLIVCVPLSSLYWIRLLSPSMHVIIPNVDPFVPSSISLYLLRRRKEKGGKKAATEALESLEAQLKDRAETLGLSLEQKTKGMKQRDKKVTYHKQ